MSLSLSVWALEFRLRLMVPDLFTAIQEQLGLKLESAKAPADVLVIDGVEKPSAPDPNGNASDPSLPPDIFTVLQEQLGLKREPQTTAVDVLVVDHMEEPSEN